MALRRSERAGRPARRGRPRYQRPIQESILSGWVIWPLVAVLGAFLATQFFTLTPRYVKLAVGAVAVLAVLRLSFSGAVTLFLFVFVMPTFIFISDTNVLLIAFLVVVWLVSMAIGRLPRPDPSPIDWAIWIYIGVHALSFINVETGDAVRKGMTSFIYLTSGALLFWLIYNAIRTEEQLHRAFVVLCALSCFVNVTALVEHFFAIEVIPEWFLHRAGQTRNAIRVGGIFGFHGLLADFNAIVFYLQIFMGMRARGRGAKAYYYGLALVGLYVVTLTVNRGGAVAWALGGIYFLFLMRRQLDWVRLAVLAPAVVAAYFLYQTVVSLGTGRLLLFARLAGTQIERGIPDTRVHAWTLIFRRIPEHIVVGHGPYYELGGVGEEAFVYPHSAYLFYLYTTGILGLSVWLWILGKLVWQSFPGFSADFRRWPLARAAQALLHVQILMFAAAQVRDEHQRGNVYLYVMWILFGLAAVSGRLVREQRARGRAAEGRRPAEPAWMGPRRAGPAVGPT